ncbi:carboxylic ester hydrolase [Polymorphobacter multimanifer]|uniref:Carboxylic ester hydrolase n=1 Tax=Polymorphobacter multimanifer TaxID=1070431 RepID=A0A841LH01_9SPHN|nr:carboxylesterase family protein [Polymorphobacter multimanifer]MBB6229075.1 para-nitrobenzyl esterase [Polymorphobacter multimanifer]GGI84469.1 carboxylic ester hydrolase [Polymorphobacter multimanifer]
MSVADGVSRRAVLGAAALLATPVRAREAAVATAAGRFLGSREGGIAVFRGIRYGRAARFRPPVPEALPNQRIEAMAFGPVAPQASRQHPDQSEDCLFLNIWTPGADAARRPVMLYIHGGAYSNGSSTDPLNEGAALAAHGDVVVVTVNHRLNAFGYLYLARLDPRFPDSGNAGQLDLVLALQWVRANIAAFGGDSANVTVFGQSGGGAKIATLMGMPAATTLFHRAITMSGQQVTASGPLNATARARAFLERLGRDPLTAPAESLVEALAATDPVLGGSVYFGPVLDMRSLTRHPFWPDANPQSNAIPMLLGNTLAEARAFLPPGSPKLARLSWDNLPAVMAPELRVDISPEWVVAQYRARHPDWSPRAVLWDAVTAGRSWRGQIEEAEARAAAAAPTWVYQLDFADPARLEAGAMHTMDIPLAFGTTADPGAPSGNSPAARTVSAAMMTAFTAFARSGTLPWPQYRTGPRTTMVFDTRSRVENDPRHWQRELFARVPYVQQGT